MFTMFLLVLLISPAVSAINATRSTYNLINSSNVNSIYDFIKEVNNLTGQVFMIGILLVSFVILFIGYMAHGTSDALFASGFITSIMTVLFAALDFIPKWIVFLIIVPYGLFWMYRMIKG